MSLIFLISYFSESDSDDKEANLTSMIKQSWMKRKLLLENDFAITGLTRSILSGIHNDVRLNLDCEMKMAIERVIAKLHLAPNPNSKVANNKIDMIIDIFWKKFGHFQNRTGVYDLWPDKFLPPDARNDMA